MYLWVIIATFLASLAVFSTSYRPDVKKVVVEPKAEAVIAKMYLQHQAMRNYVATNWRKGPGSVEPGEWKPEGSNASYAPYGFDADGGVANFTSKIYCLASKENGVATRTYSKLPVGCTNGSDPYHAVSNCCDEPDATMFLVTYGDIPSKWRNPVTGKPRAELLDAMKTSRGYIDGLGYMIDLAKDLPNDIERLRKEIPIYSRMGIVTHGKNNFVSMPTWIMAEDLDPSSDQDGPCRRDKHCLIYLTNFGTSASGMSGASSEDAIMREDVLPIQVKLPELPKKPISDKISDLPKDSVIKSEVLQQK